VRAITESMAKASSASFGVNRLMITALIEASRQDWVPDESDKGITQRDDRILQGGCRDATVSDPMDNWLTVVATDGNIGYEVWLEC
jgi:hypothetical protein